MAHRTLFGALGAAVVLVTTAASAAAAAQPTASEADARRVIAGHCARCHPPRPDGAGWVQMTDARRDRAAWASELQRMRSDYEANLSANERQMLLDFLTRTWGLESPTE